MKKLMFISLIALCSHSMAQFKGFNKLLNYRDLAVSLEPPKISPVVDFNPSWVDSSISIQREAADYLELKYPLDAFLYLRAKSEETTKEELRMIPFIDFVKQLPNLEIELSESKGKKKRSSRKYYELQRLAELVKLFDASKQDTNFVAMESVLRTMMFYYQNPSLIKGKKMYKEYQKSFISMRNTYSNIVYKCFENKTCKKSQVSMLYYFSLNAWPDVELARNVLRTWYYEEWLYLFHGIESRKSNINFRSVCECYISMLYLYNVTNIINTSDLIVGFGRIKSLTYESSYEKERVISNLRMYVSREYNIHPQG